MLRVVIDDKKINLKGSGMELLNGLSNYIYALRETGCPSVDLQYAINKGLNKLDLNDREVNIEDDVRIHKINTKDLSAEEVAKIITDIIKND